MNYFGTTALLPSRVWWPLSKKPPPLLCKSFPALSTHQAFLCMQHYWACLASRCLSILMCMKMSPYSEKKVQQEIPVLESSESFLRSCLKRCCVRQHQTLLWSLSGSSVAVSSRKYFRSIWKLFLKLQCMLEACDFSYQILSSATSSWNAS